MVGLIDNPVTRLTEYELRHLVAHLNDAGRPGEVHRLLTLLTGECRNAWFEARTAYGDTSGYLADVESAWRLADSAARTEDGGRTRAVGLQVRYALVTASVRSLAGNIPNSLLILLLDHGSWAPPQALTYVRQIPNSGQRTEALKHLGRYLPVPYLDEALVVALEIEDVLARTDAAATLAPRLPTESLRKALRAAVAEEYEFWRSRALGNLAPHLPPSLVPEALAAAHAIGILSFRAYGVH
jgi:hypothetical protein